jgi:hypothetical protein
MAQVMVSVMPVTTASGCITLISLTQMVTASATPAMMTMMVTASLMGRMTVRSILTMTQMVMASAGMLTIALRSTAQTRPTLMVMV